jgi:cyclic beta-1,2-glucan synthetase
MHRFLPPFFRQPHARLLRRPSRTGDRLGGPIRGELLGLERLVERAHDLGREQEWVLPSRRLFPRRARLLTRLRSTETLLASAHERVSSAADRQVDVGPAAGWLLDNMYLLREHIREAFEGLPPDFYGELPEASSGDLRGHPRVYELCLVLISHTEGRVDRENLDHFMGSFQEHAPLHIGELWALPAMLRMALLESVRRMARRTVLRLDEFDRADAWVTRIEEAEGEGEEQLARALEEFMHDPPPLKYIFVSRFLRQLRVRCGAHPAIARLERWISEEGMGAEEAAALATQQMALTQVIMANSITSLRTVGQLDWQDFVEGQSRMETELRRDPSGFHRQMSFETRDRFRHVVERIARRTGHSETEVAIQAVAMAEEAAGAEPPDGAPTDHVGYWLVDAGRARLEAHFGYRPTPVEHLHRWVLRHPDIVLGGGLAAGTAAALALVPWLAGSGGWGILIFLVVLIPANDIALRAMNQLLTALLPPQRLPALDLTRSGGIPPALATAVVVPTLLESPAGVRNALEHLEIQFLANRDPALRFGILGDFTDATEAQVPGDEEILEAAAKGVARLNTVHGNGKGGPFFLLHRPRLWNPSQGVWMGWERKRGKLVEFNRLIRGEAAGFAWTFGNLENMRDLRFVITLDADTMLPREAAALLVGALAHPLNRPVYDAERGRVERGYGVLQPRVGTTLPSGKRSRFASIQSGRPGVDPYTTAVSDLYQDLYGEGSFTGKGIYDVDAFRAATEGRFPENTLLSHDLIEGNYARAGLLTGVTVYDDFPGGYVSYTRRKHRWIRGDWQLLPWLRSRVPRDGGVEPNPLTRISRWKMVDNLRRSLVEPALVIFLVAGWTVLPGSPLRWTFLGLAALAAPWIIGLVPSLLRPPPGRSVRAYYWSILRDAGEGVQQFALGLTFLPDQALTSVDAVLRTLWRVLFSRRNLLEWTPSSRTERSSTDDLASIARELAFSSVLSLGLLALVVGLALGGGRGLSALVAAGPILLLWLLAPVVAHYTGRRPRVPSRQLPRARRPQAMRYALLHWRFFERFVNEDTAWLAPDNFQEDPRPVVALRTSPTNIGLQLLSTLSASELGIVPLPEALDRLERAFDTLDRLPRYRGHLYNWYDLTTLRVLEPAYVSTVDSGNLVGHLIALRQGLLELVDRSPRAALAWEATLGGVEVARERARARLREGTRSERRLGRALDDTLREAGAALLEAAEGSTTPDAPLRIAAHLEEALRAVAGSELSEEEQEQLALWMRWSLSRARTLHSELPVPGTPDLRPRIEDLAGRVERFVADTDFTFLFDWERKLFSIGWSEERRALDPSYYDLLASEARLAGFLAIAGDQVPVEHWFRLGRTLTRAGGRATSLISWSGSMFEYLMPTLVMRSYQGSVLRQGEDGAVRRQISYGAERKVPWGLSESAYNLRDREFTYQYRAFGVPDLALKRGMGRDLVIAPYASLLALEVAPDPALDNLEALERLGALGPYGFRDALDYTRPEGHSSHALVRNYMAHHIGMGMVALTNALTRGAWRRRFHADPRVRAAELLLQERLPRGQVFQETQRARPEDALPEPEFALPMVREFDDPGSPRPHVALLGRASFTAMVTHAGGGYSRHGALAVTRWRADGTTDSTGQFCYVRDVGRERVWSSAHQPVCAPADHYRAFLATDRVEFHRIDGDIETRTEIVVVPEDSAKVRHVTVVNRGQTPAVIELTSYGEVVLNRPDADRAHRAFSNLFVTTEWHEWCTALTAVRRPRSAGEARLWGVHVVSAGSGPIGQVSYETDRGRFLGRGRTARNPVALDEAGPLAGTVGAVLDPIFALRARITLEPGEPRSLAFTTLVAESRERTFDLADRYHDQHAAQRALDLAWITQQAELRELSLTPADAAAFQELAGLLIFPLHGGGRLRPSPGERSLGAGPQRLLWGHGISGDHPILLTTIDSMGGLPTLRRLFAAHHYLRRRGLAVDLVVLNLQPSSYLQELQGRILEERHTVGDPTEGDGAGAIFPLRADQMSHEERRMVEATARVRIHSDGRSLPRLLQEAEERKGDQNDQGPLSVWVSPTGRTPLPREAPPALAPPEPVGAPLRLDNGTGGFTPEGDYLVRVRGDALPPAPWSNVIANRRGGFLVTERGGGFTWAESSFFHRLTPWRNDPVSDIPGEALYLQDEESGALWSAAPAPVPSDVPYAVVHSPASTTFRHEHGGISTLLTLGMAGEDPVKVSVLRLRNLEERPRRIAVTAYVEWALGVSREITQNHLRLHFDAGSGAILARNPFDPDFGERVAFLAFGEGQVTHLLDRTAFLGRNGTLEAPAWLVHPPEGGRRGSDVEARAKGGPPGGAALRAAPDPCGVLRGVVELAPGAETDLVVLLGSGRDQAEALALLERYRSAAGARAALVDNRDSWDRRLSVVQVRTPEPSFDLLLNRWLLHQTLSCRMWGRSALYQSGGAYGFRDQLQDVMALLHAEPALVREHLLRAAGRQFVEGDVQHWWHPGTGRGVRTRFSDDLVWLPFTVDHYVRVTGDAGVLDEEIPFLEMRPLGPDEHEIYDQPSESAERASLYEHCLRALERACTRGVHGLPLIGVGDWNDGMNRVGVEGRGESVWLAWFLVATLRPFAEHARARGDIIAADTLLAQAREYADAANREGWDGAWYRRAYYDDGTPLGSASNEDCRIDSIAQSWSVISGAGDPEKAAQAMASLETHLVDRELGLIRLLTPPFDKGPMDPGYIKGYLPGVRENGAQYTHAALWAVQAVAEQGRGERAFDLFQMINPLQHTATPEGVERYRVEPYVVAADVYTSPGQPGRGGWTWYTGSASWMYRVGLESILGFRRRGGFLFLEPVVPSSWPSFSVEYRYGATLYRIEVEQPGRIREEGAEVIMEGGLDGAAVAGGAIPLVDDGKTREVVVRPRRG